MNDNENNEIYIDEEPDLNQKITGYLGSFNTNESYNVNYMMSGLSPKEFKLLDIASEAFKFDQVDFEEMVQRDVDSVRVQEELIDQYLKCGKNRALFFPPIIVSVIAFGKDEKPIHQFNNIYEERNGKKILKRWDDFFAIEAIISEKDTGAYIKDKDGIDLPIHSYASKILYDDKKVKLVVIDGQHRFFALRSLAKKQPDIIKDIYLPICIVFSPDAMSSNGGQDVMVNLRNMFVTINNKAKEVSGHFLDLLNDHSIASFCVRELANTWKETAFDSLSSKLQFMEWNQRSKSKSNQINKQHSITTISILAEVLRNNVFGNKKESKTYNLLNLGSKKKELEKDSYSTSVDYISESEFDVDQSKCIRDLVKDNVVPCLNCLLMEPSVYKHIQDSYLDGLKLLNSNVDKGLDGWLTLKGLLSEFKETNKLSPEPAVLAEKEFNKSIDIDRGIEIYRKNVFQQAYIRVWAQVSDYLVSEYEISPLVVAKCIVCSFEELVFDYRKSLFEKDQPYTALVLYERSGKPNVTVRGKHFWTEILMSFFSHQNTSGKFIELLKDQVGEKLSLSQYECIKNKLVDWGVNSFKNYCDELLDRFEKDFIVNWKIKEFPKSFKDRLEKLLTEEDQLKKEEFNALLKEKARYSFSIAISPMFGVLGLDEKILITYISCELFDDQI